MWKGGAGRGDMTREGWRGRRTVTLCVYGKRPSMHEGGDAVGAWDEVASLCPIACRSDNGPHP